MKNYKRRQVVRTEVFVGFVRKSRTWELLLQENLSLLDVPEDGAEPPPPPQAVTICESPIVATSDCKKLRFFFF